MESLKAELEKERSARILAEQKVAELTASSTRLNNLIISLQTGVMVEDENRRIILVNQHLCDLFGISQIPEAMTGWDCSDSAEQTKHLFADPDLFIERINTLLEERKLVLSDELWLTDGRCFKRDYIPVFLDGDYKGHLWNYWDITLHKNSEIALKNREEKYRRIIENMNIGLLEVDLKGKIMYSNQSFCSMSGYSSDELLGVVAEDIFMRDSDKDREIIVEKNQMREKGVYDAYQVQITDRSGEKKWWLISGAPVYDDNGILVGSIGIHLDITMQKELEFNLKEAKRHAEDTARAKEVFLANMSHEIRTPMNAILGLGKQLLKTDLDQQQQSFLNAVNTAADNLLVIINDILDFSKLEAGKMSLEKIGFNMKSLLLQAESILQQNVRAKGLEFVLETDETISPILIGDPFRINQIILNLLSNSIKFTEIGSIRLACKITADQKDTQQLLISVEDTGIGMDAKFLENIFQKFSQESVNNARKYGGTGLGMAITHQIVELMHGTIEIESNRNIGTKVRITLTLPVGVESDLPTAEKMPVSLELLKGKKILLVEDNRINRLVAGTILKAKGLEVVEALDGQEAVDIMRIRNFDLILMDLQMPVMDGITATQIIRSEINMEVPIVALTANVLKGEQDKCMNAGMNDFISKPFNENRLLQVLLNYLS